MTDVTVPTDITPTHITPSAIPQPASVRTVRAKLFEVEVLVRMAIRDLAPTADHDLPVNYLASALEELGSADRWLDHCTDR